MDERSTIQAVATACGLALLALGILGFIPGLTTDYGDMSFAGDDSGAELLGVFQVGILHNLVHLLAGVAGLSSARSRDGSRTFLLGGGAGFLLLWLLGLAGGADWLPTNTPGDWLHFGIGVTMLGCGLLAMRDRPRRSA